MNHCSKILVGSLLITLAIIASCKQAPEPVIDMEMGVPNFGLYDQNGAFHTLYYHSNAKAVVLYVQGNECPISNLSGHNLRMMRSNFS